MQHIAEMGRLSDEPRLEIGSFEELVHYEPEILTRIERVPNGGNLFMAHPFRLLREVGVELSEEARDEILELEPELSALSDAPYEALRESRERQRLRFHVHGLFRRRE